MDFKNQKSVDFKIGNYKPVVIPFLFILILVLLFLYVSKTSYERISKQLEDIKSLKQDSSILQAKVENLRSYQDHSFPDSQKMLYALPEENPVVWMLAQIKKKSEEGSVVVTGRNTSLLTSGIGDVSSAKITFKVEGETKDLLTFLLGFSSFSPLSTFDSVSFGSGFGSVTNAQVAMTVYYSKLPEKMPQLKEAVNKLTPSEEAVIEKLGLLEPPQFSSLDPSGPYEVQDPFIY